MNSEAILSPNGRNLDGPSSTQVDVFGDDFLPLPQTWNRLFRRKKEAVPADLRPVLEDPAAAHADCLWHFTGGQQEAESSTGVAARRRFPRRKPWADAADGHWTARLWRRAFPACCVSEHPPAAGCVR